MADQERRNSIFFDGQDASEPSSPSGTVNPFSNLDTTNTSVDVAAASINDNSVGLGHNPLFSPTNVGVPPVPPPNPHVLSPPPSTTATSAAGFRRNNSIPNNNPTSSFEPFDLAAAAGSIFDQPPSWPLSQPQQQQQQQSFDIPGLNQPPQQQAQPITAAPQTFSPISLFADPNEVRSPTSAFAPSGLNSALSPTAPSCVSASSARTEGLTLAQQEKLKSIVMPPHLEYHSPKGETQEFQSPVSPIDGDKLLEGGVSPSDQMALAIAASKTSSRKRKSTADDDDDDEDEEDEDGHPVKKTAHNMIEKRYRTNLNDKISALRDSVPSLRIMSKSARGEDTTVDREELHGLTPAHKLNKATVLSKATEYIRHLEKRNSRLTDENSTMQQRIGAFEKLFMAGAIHGTMNGGVSPMQQPQNPIQYAGADPSTYMTQTIPSSARAQDPQGMIQVPDDMKRILTAQMAAGQPYPVGNQPFQQNQNSQNSAVIRQQQIQQQQQQLQQRRWQQNAPPGYYGKMMVGSLAGLMIFEAIREKEQSTDKPEGRGLSALPLPLHMLQNLVSRTSINVMGVHISGNSIITSLQFVCLLGTILLMFFPALFAPSPKKREKSRLEMATLEAAPSLASPINVRRQAWLTAIQTVWMPQHDWLLEASVLVARMAKLSIRSLIGTTGYQMLSGSTEEKEAARVKAWSIALDAQLTGGDDEINKARLSLSYLASCTLPDTPLRLMQKALHLRMLFWERKSRFTFGLLNLVAVDQARKIWNAARQLNRMLHQLRRSAADVTDDEEELPDHLAVLLEQDCDHVLCDAVIQRAYNLAWNVATNQDAIGSTDGMDSVVDDSAIRSPLDAVSAWFSTSTLHKAMVAGLDVDQDEADAVAEIDDLLNMAVKTAPIGSTAQGRAVIARAAVLDERRGANIAAALQVVGSLNPEKAAKKHPRLIDAPMAAVSSPDGLMALRCAMALAHLNRFATQDHASFNIVETISPAGDMTLLGWMAAFKLMVALEEHAFARESHSSTLERLAGSLRIWIGSSAADECVLGTGLRTKAVERCIGVTKGVVGMEVDTGYGSLSEGEGEGEEGEGGGC